MSAIFEEAPGAIELVSLALAKTHLRVDIDDDNELIALFVRSARELLENDTSRSFIIKNYRMSLDAFPHKSLDSQFFGDSPPDSYRRFHHHAEHRPNYSQRIKLLRSPLDKISRISYLAFDDQQWHDLLPAPLLWAAKTEHHRGDQIADPNGNLQEVTSATPPTDASTTSSGPNDPTWETTEGLITNDGDLQWTNKGIAPVGDFLYDADSEPPRVFPLSLAWWPATARVPNAVQIHFTAGYGDAAASVPARALVAILQITANWYENRESVSEIDLKKIPTQFDNLVWSLKVQDFSPTRG